MNDSLAPKPMFSPLPPGENENIQIGQWYWVKNEEEKWLGCITEIGSNYAQLENVYHSYERIHLDNFYDLCVPEPNWRQIANAQIQICRENIAKSLEDARTLTKRLGVSSQQLIGQDSTGTSLAVVHNQSDVIDNYKTSLIVAKDKTLPEIQQDIKNASEELASWLAAETLPLVANTKEMHESIGRIKERISAVELYAGLTEEIKTIRNGPPALMGERLRLMQRTLFMDEECIAGYSVGGIDCQDILTFDEWLGRKENFERLLPFPRTIVAFQVRRYTRNRQWDGSISSLFVNFQLNAADKWTFLYIRNGDQLHRLSCAIEFGSKLFPDKQEFDLKGSWARVFAGSVRTEDLISDAEFQDRKARHEELQRKHDQWMKEHEDDDNAWIHCPHRTDYFRVEDYQPFDESSVYYDDISKEVREWVISYNRIALIIQGLFDRSPILHPHQPVKLWTADSFAAAIELRYDSQTLHFGEAPDFELYRAQCNRSLKTGSITIGQENFWELAEGKKDNSRRDKDWRDTSHYRPERHRPYGNPGPGFLAKVELWRPKAHNCVYHWQRERRLWNRWGSNDPIEVSLTVPSRALLNIDAYRPGDFRQFYSDYRTRLTYLKWSTMLLAAEEYYAGNIKLDIASKSRK